jgi:lysophospholipase L1-like esterase
MIFFKNNISIKLYVINILIFFLLILLIEIFSGNLINKSKIDCNYVLCNANYSYENQLYIPNEKLIFYRKDQYGFRYRGDTKLNKIDILVIGGSTTDERYLNIEDTWTYNLEQLFKNKTQVINAGIDGQSTKGHIWNFNNWFNKINNFKTKYIIFYVGINENDNDNGRYDNQLDTRNVYNFVKIILRKNNGFFYNNLNKIINIKDKDNVGHNSKRLTNNFTEVKHDILTEERKYSNLKNQTKERIEELIKLSRSINSVPIFITQKTLRWKIEDDNKNKKEVIYSIDDSINYYAKEKIISDAIINTCIINNVIYINAFDNLKLNTEDTYDYVHTNPKGSKKISEFIYENLREINILGE